ncbi:MAG: hypothetical protein AAGD86_04625 [Pseudomonadota bacterium]
MNDSTPLAPAFLLDSDTAPGGERVTVCSQADASTLLFVDSEAGCDQHGDGTWQRPFASLRAALAAVGPDCEGAVCVAPR